MNLQNQMNEMIELISSYKEVGKVSIAKGTGHAFSTKNEFPEELEMILKEKYPNWVSYSIVKREGVDGIWDLIPK